MRCVIKNILVSSRKEDEFELREDRQMVAADEFPHRAVRGAQRVVRRRRFEQNAIRVAGHTVVLVIQQTSLVGDALVSGWKTDATF